MLKGDLTTTSLRAVLRSLSADEATGCLHVDDGVTGEARVYLRTGKAYAVVLPGRTPRLGASLVASGDLSPADLAEATEAQRTELQGWRLGELLVHLGYVSQPVVEAFVSEQLREAAAELALWPSGRWKFRPGERTREDVAPPVPVEDLLAEVDRRRTAFDALAPVVHGPDAVPVLSSAGSAPETQELDPQAWSLLCAVDGERSLAALAATCGLSLYDAGALIASLVEAGLVEVESPAAAEVAEVAEASDAAAADADDDFVGDDSDSWAEVHSFAPLTGPAGIAARLADALKGLGTPAAMAPTLMPGEDDHRVLDARVEHDDVDGSVERASGVLAEALGPATGELELFPVDGARRHAPVIPLDAKQAQRRARDAAELAERLAELEAARASYDATPVEHLATESDPLADAAKQARLAEETHAAEVAAAAEAAEQARLEQVAQAEEVARQAEEARAAQAQAAAEADAEAARQAEEARAAQAATDAAEAYAAAAAEAQAARDQQRLSAAIQAEAFAELSAAATSAGPDAVAQDEPTEAEPLPVERYVEAMDEPTYPPRGADTAALLRELSSLGFDDEPAPTPVPRPRPTAAPSAATVKKRKGLFSRS